MPVNRVATQREIDTRQASSLATPGNPLVTRDRRHLENATWYRSEIGMLASVTHKITFIRNTVQVQLCAN